MHERQEPLTPEDCNLSGSGNAADFRCTLNSTYRIVLLTLYPPFPLEPHSTPQTHGESSAAVLPNINLIDSFRLHTVDRHIQRGKLVHTLAALGVFSLRPKHVWGYN